MVLPALQLVLPSRVGRLHERCVACVARRGRGDRSLRRPDRAHRARASSRVPPGFVPTQDKEYLVAFAQLPDGSTLDRTDSVIRKMTDIALKHPGVLSSVAFPGLSINGFVNSPNTGIAFVVLKPSEERKSAGLERRRDRRCAEPAVLPGDPGIDRGDLPATSGAGARHGRRLQAVRRGSRRHRVRGSLRAAAGEPGEGADGAVAGRTLLELPGQRAADRRRRRSRAREELRRLAHRRVRDAAGLPRLALRQRLQPVRPHLPGQRAGGGRVPLAAGADPPAADTQRPRRDGAAWFAHDRDTQLRAGSGDALQRLSRGGDQRWSGAGLQLGSGAGGDCRRARHAASARHVVRVDGARVSGAPGRQHDAADLPALRAAGLHRPGRAVRELDAAAHRDPHRADDAVLGDRGRVAHRR